MRREGEIEQAALYFAGMMFMQRMRTAADRRFIMSAFAQTWGLQLPSPRPPPVLANPKSIQIGWATLQRSQQGMHS